jgi:hypothetical protein
MTIILIISIALNLGLLYAVRLLNRDLKKIKHHKETLEYLYFNNIE